MKTLKYQDYLNELNATMKRTGRGYRIYAIDGQKLSEPKNYRSRAEMTADLKDWYENGWQQKIT